MRTIVRLLIVAALLHALFRAGQATVTYYTFRDAAEQIARHEGDRSDVEVRRRVLDSARASGVPLAPEQVSVQRDDGRTTIEVRYREAVELLPRYRYPWDFHFVVSSGETAMLTGRDRLPR